MNKGYQLIDSGHGRKLERFGPYLIDRPCSQAVWKPKLPLSSWEKAEGFFTREEEARWEKKSNLPKSWEIEVADIHFKIAPTDFGHLGIFPEQAPFWKSIFELISQKKKKSIEVLNLFAYSGGCTLAAAKAGAKVCHLDASKTMVAWARENAELNQLDKAPIRWIVDDVFKFMRREIKRGHFYDAIILDPPSFGRGTKGELFKIEDQIIPLLEICKALLKNEPLFLLFSCHTPGFTPLTMHNLLKQLMANGKIESGEMVLEADKSVYPIPSGVYAKWHL